MCWKVSCQYQPHWFVNIYLFSLAAFKIFFFILQSVQLLSHVQLFADPMNRSTPGLPVHHQLLEFYSNSSPSSQWCHPAISSSVIPFSSCPQSLPASGSFPMSQLFAWGGQSTGVSALASVLSMTTQDRSPLYLVSYIFTIKRLGSNFFSLHSLGFIWFLESKKFNEILGIFQTLFLWISVTNILFWRDSGVHKCWNF